MRIVDAGSELELHASREELIADGTSVGDGSNPGRATKAMELGQPHRLVALETVRQTNLILT